MAAKTAYVRLQNAGGSNVYSLDVTQPDPNEFIGSGGLQMGGAAATSFGTVANKTAHVRLQNANGSNVYSLNILQPTGQYEYAGSGGMQIGGAAVAVAGSPYQVTIDTPNANTAIRLVSSPVDLQAGFIVRWFNVVGGTQADVTVFDDGTFDVAGGVTSFDWQVFSEGAWGEVATQYITDSNSNSYAYTGTGGVQTGGAAVTSFGAAAGQNQYTYAGSGGLSLGGAAATSFGTINTSDPRVIFSANSLIR